ncbi:FecR family protein [uncultured Chitinophaga sp.]|uniref:FecR family protein n=1 Tax=uncultured Chitinophaga sp. TaxID=339340 RepID=UPI0025E0D20C|nr:FecR family protein [uncultured Chitinophaga sp.]
MMTVANLTELLLKHLQGNLTEHEQQQLDEWISESNRNQRLFESVDDEEQLRQQLLAYHIEELEDNEGIILSKIRQRIGTEAPVTPVRRIQPVRRWVWAAASVALLVAATGGYLLLTKEKTVSTPTSIVKTQTDILPGKTGAVLTLADGSQVVLDSMGNGVIGTQNGTQLTLKNGELAYDNAGAGAAAVVYNNLVTPNGRQFQLVLPDGTKVWLNAASSLRYPTAFSGKTREVAVTGEVYFEVAQNANQPFIIDIDNRAHIQVLGTSFNVNAYDNEANIKTTLVDGSVKVFAGGPAKDGAFVVLQPGQQAHITDEAKDAIRVVNRADVDKAVAWKSGIFNFNNSSLEEVMRQVARWYDIEVVYENTVPDIRFGGKLSNDVSLTGLLQSLKESEVNFRIEGRRLIVMP